jgi:hypothetical protein
VSEELSALGPCPAVQELEITDMTVSGINNPCPDSLHQGNKVFPKVLSM